MWLSNRRYWKSIETIPPRGIHHCPKSPNHVFVVDGVLFNDDFIKNGTPLIFWIYEKYGLFYMIQWTVACFERLCGTDFYDVHCSLIEDRLSRFVISISFGTDYVESASEINKILDIKLVNEFFTFGKRCRFETILGFLSRVLDSIEPPNYESPIDRIPGIEGEIIETRVNIMYRRILKGFDIVKYTIPVNRCVPSFVDMKKLKKIPTLDQPAVFKDYLVNLTEELKNLNQLLNEL